MRLVHFLLPVLSFAAGAAGKLLFRTAPKPAPISITRLTTTAAGTLATALSNSELPAAALALTGLSARPSLDEVLNATGIDRPLRMALYLQTATSSELQEVLKRCRTEGIYDLTTTDQIWLRWAEIDNAAAQTLGGPAYWWACAKVDPMAAMAAAQGVPYNLEAVLRSIGQGDHRLAMQLMADHPGTDTPMVWEGILSGVFKQDPSAAVTLAMQKGVKLKETLDDWTALAPEKALAWAQQLADPNDRRHSLDLVLTKLASSDPVLALRESNNLPPGSSRNKCIAESISALALQDPDGARAAVEALPNAADRRAAFSLLTSNLADRDPATALEMLTAIGWKDQSPSASFKWDYNGWDHPSSESKTFTSSGSSLVDTTIASLMMASPKATADALTVLPPEQHGLLSGAMISWANQQPEAASRWLQALPTGSAKDRAIEGLNNWLTSGSPEPDYAAALAWATAATPDRRVDMMQSTLSRWKSQDATAARAAVDRLPITEEQRQRLLQNFN